MEPVLSRIDVIQILVSMEAFVPKITVHSIVTVVTLAMTEASAIHPSTWCHVKKRNYFSLFCLKSR